MNTAGSPRGAVGPMTNTPTEIDTDTITFKDAKLILARVESNTRLLGTLVNELQDARQDFQERTRQLADIYSRLEAQAAMDRAHTEIMQLWSGRLELVESTILDALLEDQEDRAAFAQQMRPMRGTTNRALRNTMALADTIAAPPAQPMLPPPERWSV
jgi:hypothetical protein